MDRLHSQRHCTVVVDTVQSAIELVDWRTQWKIVVGAAVVDDAVLVPAIGNK